MAKIDKKTILKRSEKIKKAVNISMISLLLVTGAGYASYRTAWHIWGASWVHLETSSQQKSFIKALTAAVKANYKPETVEKFAGKDKLTFLKGNYRYQAAELIYTSYQNTALYYNNYANMLQGEISYDQLFNGVVNPVAQPKAAAKMVSGYLAQTHNSHFLNYYLGNARIISLPDFAYLKTNYYKDASPDLKLLFDMGANAQAKVPFLTDHIDAVTALSAYDQVTKDSANLYKTYPNSKYNADSASLARFYFEAILPTDYNLNLVETSNGQHRLTKAGLKSLQAAARKNSSLHPQIVDYLHHVNKKTRVIPESYLSKVGNSIDKLFGTSVYYQTNADLSALMQHQPNTSTEAKK